MKLLMLTSGIRFALSGHDTLRPLGIYFEPLQIVYMILNHKRYRATLFMVFSVTCLIVSLTLF